MKKSEATALVAVLVGSYPSARIENPDATCNAYVTHLVDLEYDAVAAAITRLIRTSKWLPTIAEIRQATAELNAGGVNRAELAYADVLRAISKFGPYQTPEFDDPLVHVAVAALGWQAICKSENVDTVRAQFRMAYHAAKARLGELGSVDRLLKATGTDGLRGLHDSNQHRQLGPAPIGSLGAAVLRLIPDGTGEDS